MRDAIVAAINLNIFNKHSDRIIMANIAQVVNVLQAMVLTEGLKMIKTPTYEVFALYKAHQGAMLVDSTIENLTESIEDVEIPVLSESVSVQETEEGKITHITLSNASLDEAIEVKIQLPIDQKFAGEVTICELTGAMQAHNTFEHPEEVKRHSRTETAEGHCMTVVLPPCSVCSISCPVVS